MLTTDESFSLWLSARHITEKSITGISLDLDNICRDFDNKRSSSGTTKYVSTTYPAHSVFLPEIESDIDEILEKVDKFSLRKHLETSNGSHTTFVENIKSQNDNVEPVWSSTKISDPAMLLLPPEERLFVDDTLATITISDFLTSERYPDFKNNLFATYSSWMFYVEKSRVYVHSLDRFLDASMIKSLMFYFDFSEYFFIDYGRSRFPELRKPEEDSNEHEDSFNANFIKVTKLMQNDVLCVCTHNGLLIFYDIKQILKLFGKKYEPLPTTRLESITPHPILILRVFDSCWSVDVYENSNTVYIAAGHNEPGISIFAIDKTNLSETKWHIIKKDIPTLHNVPSLTFVADSEDKNGYITLAYTTIKGNVSTLKIKYIHSDNNLDIHGLDTYFIGEKGWTVTPLKRKDFKKVNEFELLNQNFSEVFKKSILYSVVLDSKILAGNTVSISRSGDFGLGTLTTQIPVPTSNLGLTYNAIKHTTGITLRFTSFDDKRFKINGNFVSPGHPLDIDISPSMNTSKRVSSVQSANLRYYYIADFLSNYSNQQPGKNNYLLEHWKNIINAPPMTPNNGQYQYKFNSVIDDINHIRFDKENVPDKTLHSIGGYRHKQNKLYCSGLRNGNFLFPTEVSGIDRRLRIGYLKGYNYKDPKNSTISSVFNDDFFDRIHEDDQLEWTEHQHVTKVKKLLSMVKRSNKNSPAGYEMTDLDDDFLFVTSERYAYLVKTNPLIVTSFTPDEIFPTDMANFCNKGFVKSLNRINIMCHMKEINCIAVASQLGLVSLLRLTEFNGVYSFRQEYILGWVPQKVTDEVNQCALVNVNPYFAECHIDEMRLPFFNIVGMDYSYYPPDTVNNLAPYVILNIACVPFNTCSVYRYKICAGKTPYMTRL